MDPTLRESLERERRAKLHRQIGALRTQLESLNYGRGASYTISRIKLANKIKRLEAELWQPMLLSL